MNKKYKALLNGASSLGAGNVLKALGKVAPAISPFITGAYVAGYAADEIADFLKNRFSTPEERRNQANLQERSAARVARPDERAELSQIEQGQAPLSAISQTGKLAGQAAGYVGSARAGQKQQQEQEELEAYQRERQQELDQERRAKEQQAQSSRVKKESMASEKHKMQMEKGKSKLASAPKSAPFSKGKLGKPPEDYIDAIRELDELINRLP